MIRLIKSILFGVILFSSTLFSQPDFPDAPRQGPIDGFSLVILAFVGAALGYKKLKK